MYKNFLLSDENEICKEDYLERKRLIKEFSTLPIEFFSKLRHFQPQIGCLNACKICSKFAGTTTEYWTEKRQRNIISALKYSSPKEDRRKPLIVWDRFEHRTGVIFSYLDNDIGNYPYLYSFIKLAYRELGVLTRISTVGYSRHNQQLNQMHAQINKKLLNALGGVRLSFTPYEAGWECAKTQCFSRYDYVSDIANFLKIYKPYYNKVGTGSRKMCVEIRYKPLVKIAEVFETDVLGHKVICTGNYLYISVDVINELKVAQISDPYDHKIKLTEKATLFFEIDLYDKVSSIQELKKIAFKFLKIRDYKVVQLYLMQNAEGIYYSINPSIEENGNFGFNIYPQTDYRVNSGYIVTERFLVNSMIHYKAKRGLKSLEKFDDATWEDVYNTLEICMQQAQYYEKRDKKDKSQYIMEEILPMVNAYVTALQEADYNASDFFNPEFTIDTGIICNLGRAVSEFCGLTSKKNEPLTPTHERNYGRYKSKMSQEGTAWRLSCDYNNTVTIEELQLFNTTDESGQVSFRKQINLNENDEILKQADLDTSYQIPGQRRR